MKLKNEIHYKNIEKLFKFTRQTWAKWKKEDRPIVYLLSYFENKEIEEFLATGKIDKLELIKNYNIDELRKLLSSDYNRPLKKGVIRSLLLNFNRSSLVYFLYIFKEVKTIQDYDSLYTFINIHSKSPESIIDRFTKFCQHLQPIYLGNNNLSFDGHIYQFKKDLDDYFDSSDLNYILKNKDEFYNIILEITKNK